MGKIFVLGFGFCVILAFTSCKSSESAYKKAYDKAMTDQLVVTNPEELTPVTPTPPVITPPVVAQPAQSNDVRQEQVTYVSGNEALKAFSIVSGSFSLKANAEALKNFLTSEGYNATIAFNADREMYRVIVDSYNDRESAIRARDAFRAKYPERSDFQGSWLLYRIY